MFSHENFNGCGVNLSEERIDGLVQVCSNSIANALELLQFCTKPSICINNNSHIRHRTNIWHRSRGSNTSVYQRKWEYV